MEVPVSQRKQSRPDGGVERRSSDRFPIEREVRYRILSKRNTYEEGTGKTINISSDGVLFTTDRVLLPGKRVELSISWPAQLDNKCQLKLVARGLVARLEQGRAAVEIQQYEFRTQGSRGLSL
jgi:PilZ domain